MTLMPTTLVEIMLVLLTLVVVATFFYGLGKAHKAESNVKKECSYCGGAGLAKGISYIEICPHCRGRGVWTNMHGKMKEGKK